MDEKSKNKDLIVCGYNSVDALIARNPQKIKRFFFSKNSAARFGDFCKLLAKDKKIYRLVTDEELQKISGTVHNQGVAAVIDQPFVKNADEMLLIKLQSEKEPVLFLDSIGNAHNLGTIARNAAFFGLKHIVYLATDIQAKPSAAAYRVAEGGMEYINFYQVKQEAVEDFFAVAKRYYFIAGTTLKKAKPLNELKSLIPAGKLPFLILGNEEKGMSLAMENQCDLLVKIPGSGLVESLNVSSASAVLFNYIMNS